MNNQSIEEGNRIIAEFMVWTKVGNRFEMSWTEGEWERNKSIKATEFNYHSNWSQLMPLVEKIQSIDITPPPNYKGYRIEIVVQGYVKIEGFPMPPIFTNVSREGSLIAAVWKAVITFIKWYNQTKTSNGK